MLYYIVKLVLSAGIIVAVSEVAKVNTGHEDPGFNHAAQPAAGPGALHAARETETFAKAAAK